MKVSVGVVQKLAKLIAKRYKRRCWWSDLDDMEQEATIAILRCQRTFDPNTGIPFEAYAWKAGVFAVRKFLWKNSAPVTGAGAENLKLLANLHRADVSHIDSLWHDDLGTHAMFCQRDWVERIKTRLVQLSETLDQGGLALDALLGEDVDSRRSAYRATARLKRRAMNDVELYQLWKEA